MGHYPPKRARKESNKKGRGGRGMGLEGGRKEA